MKRTDACPLCNLSTPVAYGTYFDDAALIEPVLAAFSNNDAWYSDKTSQQVLDDAGLEVRIEDHGGHQHVRRG